MKTMSDICRICLKKQNVMYSIYDKYSDEYNEPNEPICDMIMYCASVKIGKGDGLPNLLCQICKARLRAAYLFKRDCEESDNILHQMHQTIQIDGINYRVLTTEKDDYSQIHQFENSSSPMVVLQVIPETDMFDIDIKSEPSDDDEKMDVTEDIQRLESDTEELQPEENPTEADTSLNTRTAELVKQKIEEITKRILKRIPKNIKSEPSDDHEKMDVTEDIQQLESNTEELQPEENPTEADTSTNTPTAELVKQKIEEVTKRILKRIPKKLRRPRPKKFYCYGCSLMFTTKGGLDVHMSENHPEQKFVCNLENCNKEFTNWIKYSVHLKVDHSVENCFTCRKCQTSYQQKAYLDKHIFSQHGDRPYVCEHCSKRFQIAKALERHLNVHTEKYKCKLCDKCFPSESVLQNHRRIHNTEDSYECYECDEKFSTKLFLKRHICKKNRKAEENKKVRNHLCPYCAKRFFLPHLLSNHILIHTGAKPFKCDYCEYRCSTKEGLASHVRIHTGERPYKCSYCGKDFRQKSCLTIHERFHSGHRPYVCSTCQKGFTNSKDLKVHERTHTGIKLFSCDICDSSFTTKHYLGVHKKKHEK